MKWKKGFKEKVKQQDGKIGEIAHLKYKKHIFCRCMDKLLGKSRSRHERKYGSLGIVWPCIRCDPRWLGF